jgi:hypothetical protein
MNCALKPSSVTVAQRRQPPLALTRALLPILSAAALLCPIQAFSQQTAQAASSVTDARQTYLDERARCLSAPADEDRAACLQSAGAAYGEARLGRLDVAEHPYEANKRSRCEPLPPQDREDCIKRMEGAGTISGSVEGGGIFRELRTRTVVQPEGEPDNVAPDSLESQRVQ